MLHRLLLLATATAALVRPRAMPAHLAAPRKRNVAAHLAPATAARSVAIATTTWAAWSLGVRAWAKRKYRGIAVAAAAANGANATEMGALVATLPRGRANGHGNVLWRGPIGGDVKDGWRSGGRALSVRISDATATIYGRPGTPRRLDALVFARTRLRVVEDVGERLVWDAALKDASGKLEPRIVNETSGELDWDWDDDAGSVNGEWTFCYRDYVDDEEAGGIARRRLAFASIPQVEDSILRMRDGNATLVDSFRLLGIVPLKIGWRGRKREDVVEWHTSWLRVGWSRWGATIDRPPPAEAARRIPWRVCGPREHYGVLVVERAAGGLAAYRKEPVVIRPGKTTTIYI
jgi:hypothetical protein